MRYQFIFTKRFNRNLRALRKHNPRLRSDLEFFLTTLDVESHPVIPQTGGARKARMKGKGKGKRGGYRVIYYAVVDDVVWLITIYDKVKKETLSSAEKTRIHELIQAIKTQSSTNT